LIAFARGVARRGLVGIEISRLESAHRPDARERVTVRDWVAVERRDVLDLMLCSVGVQARKKIDLQG